MAIKPVLFNTQMVQAIQAGVKTVTRRVVKPQPEKNQDTGQYRWKCFLDIIGENELKHKLSAWMPPYYSGDVLWVRETWHQNNFGLFYKADWPYDNCPDMGLDEKWRPSIHMPKEAARLFLRVTDVRVERLQDMYLVDCLKEGVQLTTYEESDLVIQGMRARERFSGVWDSTIKSADLPHYGWDANPWVWVIEFERCEKPAEWLGEAGEGGR